MAPGAPRGKRKVTRGGGKKFSRNLKPLDPEDHELPAEALANSGSDNESSSSEEESSADESRPSGGASGAGAELTREERRAAAKAKKEAAKARTAGNESDEESEPELGPPIKAGGKNVIKTSNPNDPGSASTGPSRKEREAAAAVAAKERFWKMQERGETDQAKRDLERLAIIRKEREEKAAQRKAEIDERKAAAEVKASMKGGKRK